jgi:hypothetical protein
MRVSAKTQSRSDNSAAFDMPTPGTRILRHGLLLFTRERAKRRPGYSAPLTSDAKIEFRGADLGCPSPAAAGDLPSVSHTRHTPLRSSRLCHEYCLVG